MNNVDGNNEILEVKTIDEIPNAITKILDFVECVFTIKTNIKKGKNIYSSNILQRFSDDTDSGFESYTNDDEPSKISSKAVLYCLENGDIKNILEECLETLLTFLQSQKIYKFHLNSVETCKNMVFRLIKHMEENDEIDHITSACKTFLDSIWDTFEDDDLLQFQYILRMYEDFANLYYLHSLIINILHEKLINITSQMKKNKCDSALSFVNNQDLICQSVTMLQIKLIGKHQLAAVAPGGASDKIFDTLGNLEMADDYLPLCYLAHKVALHSHTYGEIEIGNREKDSFL